MIQKWKTILTNWINCYSTEDEKIQQNITPENLLNIFTTIHENFKLDDSKSSKFEAHNFQDFIVEKYPEFKFENGTEVFTENEVYIAASLLLFFICVNSKNEDIKRVMCSKLNTGDQETILKFSKCLMECSPILYADVIAAISEACGQDVPGTQVAETPPALRSLHGEVRRLQAALDAERFDRNYLQEELARTNLKLDKLTKDKEQYKLDILNLKAKISLCCGEQREDRGESRADDSRLQRQLQDLEERLVETQGRLDDILHERDTYRKKVEDLKKERDKWLVISQEEADRAGQLLDQLETERRTMQSLKDLVAELRQHNRNNGLDASLLECDDPDTSIQSLQNMSVCSEACANVVEVQLGEERAKVLALMQEIKDLQNQLSQANQRYESEKLSLEAIIIEKDNHVSEFKQRIEAESEDKANLKTNYDQEVAKLNEKNVELVQKIKDNEESSRLALEEKIHEMELLQQYFAEENRKSRNLIKNLKIELDAEKYSQLKLKDDFDDRIMKLNEKVLNRNNELVELQNNIIKKSEIIEVIQSDLRREKELRDELSNSCNNQLLKLNDQRIKIENEIQQKSHEIAECQKQLQERDLRIDNLKTEVDKLYSIITSLEDKCHHKESKIIEKQKEIEFLNDVFQKEQENLTHKADERYATIKSLQMQLQNEIEYKVQLQNKLTQLEASNTSLVKEVNEVRCKSEGDLLDKENMLDAIVKELREEKKLNEDFQQNIIKLNDELTQLKTSNTSLLKEVNEVKCKCQADLVDKENMVDAMEKQLREEKKLNEDFQQNLKKLNDELTQLETSNTSLVKEVNEVKCKSEADLVDKENKLDAMEKQLREEKKLNEDLQQNIKKLNNELTQLETSNTSLVKEVNEVKCKSEADLADKENMLDAIVKELREEKKLNEVFQQNIKKLNDELTQLKTSNTSLLKEVNEVKCKCEADLVDKENMLDAMEKQLREEKKLNEDFQQNLKKLNDELTQLETSNTSLVKEVNEVKCKSEADLVDKENKLDAMEKQLREEKKLNEDLQQNIKKLNNELTQLETSNTSLVKEVNEVKCKSEADLADKENMLDAIVKELREEKKLNEDFQQNIKKKNDELTQLKISNTSLVEEVNEVNCKREADLADKENMLDAIVKELREEKKLNEDLQQNIKKLNDELTQLNISNTSLVKEVNEVKCKRESDLVDKENMFDAMEKQLREEKKLNEDFQQTIKKLNDELTQLKTSNASLLKEVNEVKCKREADLVDKDNKLDAMEKQLREEKKLNEDLQQNIKKKDDELTQLETSNTSLVKKVNEVKSKSEADLADKENKLDAVEKQLREEKKLNEDLQQNIKTLNDELTQLEISNTSLVKEVNEVKCKSEADLADKENKLDAVEKQLREEKKLNEDLQQNIKKLNDELTQLETSNTSLVKKVNEVKSKSEADLADKENKLDAVEKQLREEKKLNEDLQQNIKKLNDELTQLETSNTSLVKKVNEFKCKSEADLADKENMLDAMEKQLREEKKLNEDLQQNIKKLNNELTQLETSNTSLVKEVNEFKCKSEADLADKENMLDAIVKELREEKKLNEEFQQNLKKLNDELTQLKISNTSLVEEVNEVKCKREADLADKENMLDAIVKELREEKKLNEDFQQNIKTLNDELTQLEISNTSLVKEVNEVKCKRESDLVDKENMFDAMEKQLREEKKLNEDFQQTIKKLNDELTQLKTSNASLLKELNGVKCKREADLVDKDNKLDAMEKQLREEKKLNEDFLQSIKKLNDELTAKNTKIKLLKDQRSCLEQEIKSLEEKLINKDDIIKSMDIKLSVMCKENSDLQDSYKKIGDEKTTLVAATNEKLNDHTKLKTVYEKLCRDHHENKQNLRMLEVNLKEEIKKNEQLQDINEKNTSKLLLKLEKTEKSIKKIQTQSKSILDSKELHIETLKMEITSLQQTIESERDVLNSHKKEKEVLEQNLRQETFFKNRLEVEYQKKCKMLEDITSKLKEEISLKNQKIDHLSQAVSKLENDTKEFQSKVEAENAAKIEMKEEYEKQVLELSEKELRNNKLLIPLHSESLKTISDLERIIQDKNQTITRLQTEVTYIKSMLAEIGVKHMDVSKELEVSHATCEELSAQLKKLAQQKNEEITQLKRQKNEEITELKRQVLKMSATENRATQIIKVSAKYQAMILKRVAEIKNTVVLKELTNFGNANNGDELRRGLTAGSITMEDLENFLETTDRHLKRCSEKQIALQKDRDRLTEVNRINESEIINMKKFLTEMSVSFRTFSTVKEVYCQKLSKVVSLQRTVRRDMLALDGRVTEAAMCRLERGYAAALQDLAECALGLERWAERSVGRLLAPERIQQAFTSDAEPTALATANYQNAAVEVQLGELDHSFQKLLEEVARASRGEGARAPHEVTLMEVRAEYEDKLNRMKAKMKELFHDEMGRLKQKQSEEIAVLERELIKSREKLAESSRAYEEHIRALTTELWSVGEKFLVKQEEADWLRKKHSGSLMSLQHVHSGGLKGSHEVMGRPSDTLSLRSLPMHGKKTESRGMHMSDEEGEVFDNRFLKELAATPRASPAPGRRLSELKRRNSLVPPHLKSSYPAETQFATIVDEDDIKCVSTTNFSTSRQQRKEVGITAYKKPGPPTPSKQAGRLSATDMELRESMRVEADPHAGRKTSTPSRLRSLFRSSRADGDEGTPRSRRFSSIFRKK